MIKALSVFRSAISDGDGQVDAGYLGLFWVLAVTVGAVPLAMGGLFIEQIYADKHAFNIVGLGQFLGFAAAAFGGCATAVGAFRRLDRPPAPAAGVLQKTETTSTSITAPT